MSFLSSMLPAIIGAGAVAATGGAAAPWVAGGLGALQYKRTGSLQKGIMAGLGAYGGGQLASGMLEAGAMEAANAAVPQTAAMTDVGAQKIAENYGMMDPGATAGNIQSQATQGYADKFMQAKNAAMNGGFQQNLSTMGDGLSAAIKNPSAFASGSMGGGWNATKALGMAAAPAIGEAMTPAPYTPPVNTGVASTPQYFKYESGAASPLPAPDVPGYGNLGQDFGRQQSYFPNAGYKQITAEESKQLRGYAAGGMMDAAGGGPVELMSDQAAIGANTGYPMSNMTTSSFATPYQDPRATNVMAPTGGASVNQMTGEMTPQGTRLATGGIADAHYNLGGYSDGGRLLRGPGDGVSDSIPAMIGQKQPARLADGEFVVPARIVSELGNGSTEAGARRLYAMMDRVQKARGKTTGKKQVAKNTRADRFLPA
jgi:hypothetical protein